MKSKVLYAAEKRGFRIQNQSPSNLNDTLSNFKSKTNHSNVISRKSSDRRMRMGDSNQDLPDYLDKYTLK